MREQTGDLKDLREARFKEINAELKQYSEKLVNRKQIIVANKIDVMQNEDNYKKLEELAKKENLEIYKISAVTGEGIDRLMNRVSEVLKQLPKEDLIDVEERMIYTLENKNEFDIIKDGEDFVVSGPAVDRLMGRVNIQDNESMYYFQKCIRELGIEEKLRQMGVKEGDTVRILDWHFEWEN